MLRKPLTKGYELSAFKNKILPFLLQKSIKQTSYCILILLSTVRSLKTSLANSEHAYGEALIRSLISKWTTW